VKSHLTVAFLFGGLGFASDQVIQVEVITIDSRYGIHCLATLTGLQAEPRYSPIFIHMN
jgi:hypothetical protein